MADSEPTPTTEETQEESIDSRHEGDFDLGDQNPEHRDAGGEEALLDSEKENTPIEFENQKDGEEKIDPISKFIVDNVGGKQEEWKEEYELKGYTLKDGVMYDDKGASVNEIIRNSDLSAELKLEWENMLQFLINNPGELHMMPDRRVETDEIIRTSSTAITVDKEGRISSKTLFNEEKKLKEEPTGEKPIEGVEQQVAVEEILNIEIDKEETQEIAQDQDIVIDEFITPEITLNAEEIVAQETNAAPVETTPIISAETIQGSNQTELKQPEPVVNAKEIVQETMTLEDRIMELLRDEPVDKIDTPLSNIETEIDTVITGEIMEVTQNTPSEEKEEVVQVEIPELSTLPVETIEQTAITKESIVPLDSKLAESVKAPAEEIKTRETSEIEKVEHEKAISPSRIETAKIVDTGVVSPYVEISTAFKSEIKAPEKEAVLVNPNEKIADDAIGTPDIPVNTVTDITGTEKEIISEIETSEEVEVAQVVQPEITEEIQTERAIESELVSATSEVEEQVATEATITPAEKEIVEVTIQAPVVVSTEIPVVLSEVKNEVKSTTEKETNKTEAVIAPKIETAGINNKTITEKAIDLQSPSFEKPAQIADKIEKSLPIEGHEMLLHILGLPPTKNKPNPNESQQTRRIPYSTVEPDSTDIKLAGRSSFISRLNGITLKRAA